MHDTSKVTVRGRQALYMQVVDDLKLRIEAALVAPGERLPSIASLSVTYGVSHITTRSAIAELVRCGYVYSRPRSGVFVSDRHPVSSLPGGSVIPANDGASRRLAPFVHRATVGMIAVAAFSDLTGPLHYDYHQAMTGATLHGIERCAAEYGAVARFAGINLDARIGEAFPLALDEHLTAGVNGIIVVDLHGHPGVAEQVAAHVERIDIPLVYVSSGQTTNPPLHVYSDNRAAGLAAGEHMMRQGYSPLVFVAPIDARWADERIAGVRLALSKGGADPRSLIVYPDGPVRITYAQFLRDSAWVPLGSAADQIASMPQPGVIAMNDLAARELMDLLEERGRTSGGDYGIIGFDDEPAARQRGLSSVRPPFEALGVEASRLLMSVFDNHTLNAEIRLTHTLVPRMSTIPT
ncbi:MAG: GntR family transcriptional regulator [Capsulimonadaceae bacterium]|nr:GntR family transcriptional regulator [Capsulimonadaceae bacterium]